jgi:hypothetical protein
MFKFKNNLISCINKVHSCFNALPKKAPPELFLNGRLQVLSPVCWYNKNKVRPCVPYFYGRSDNISAIRHYLPCLLSTNTRVTVASTLSLKKLHRSFFLTVAFKSCQPFAGIIKIRHALAYLIFMVGVTMFLPLATTYLAY